MITLPKGLSILNCGEGDIKISFDKSDVQEAARAERVVKDMLDRGYIIFAYDAENNLHRVTGFDPQTCEYLIADGPSHDSKTKTETKEQTQKSKSAKKGTRAGKRLPAESSKAVAVARTAGG